MIFLMNLRTGSTLAKDGSTVEEHKEQPDQDIK